VRGRNRPWHGDFWDGLARIVAHEFIGASMVLTGSIFVTERSTPNLDDKL
jgi:hypothetical protein